MEFYLMEFKMEKNYPKLPRILNGILNGILSNGKKLPRILNGNFGKSKWKSVHEHKCGFRLLVYIFYHHSS